MLAIKTLVASALLALVVPSFAAPTVLTFEDAPLDATRVDDTYLASFGITFSANAWMAASAAIGGYGNFYGPGAFDANKGAVGMFTNPYPDNGVPNTSPGSFTITVANGFDDFFSLRYAGEAATTVTAYNKAGDVVKTTSGGGTAICNGNFACNWAPLELQLGDTDVFSITVFSTNSKDWFDDFTFGRLLPASDGGGGGNVPEPGGVALSLAALGALAWSRKRTKS